MGRRVKATPTAVWKTGFVLATRVGHGTRPLRDALAARRPGDRVRVTWRSRSGERSAELTLAADPRVEVVPFEAAGRSPSAEQLAFRNAWLGSRQR